MIYPTEMTVATGTVIYSGDPESDERIASREVRVSVTYEIDDEEANLADLAFAKAAEVERARLAALERIGSLERIERDRMDPSPTNPADTPFDPAAPGLEPPDDGMDAPDDMDNPSDDMETHDDMGAPEEDDKNAPDARDLSGARPGNGYAARSGVAAAPPVPPAGAAPVTPPETDWATRPQVLALGSHFRRLGLSPQDQTALLRDRFGKFRPERLTKDEAVRLMRSLERGEVVPGPVAPASDLDRRHPAAAHA